MKGFRRLVSFLAAPLAVVFFVTSSGLTSAHAGLVTTEEATQQLDTSLDRDALLSLIEREDVRQELIAHGVDPEEATARIAALSDDELSQIMHKIDTMPAGESTVGVIVGAALIVFLVLLLTDILGFTDVFPFTK